MSHGIRPTGHKVKINERRCVHCGRCLKVCARKNFRQTADGKVAVVEKTNCNGCTKCRDACLTKAIAVGAEPMQKYESARQLIKRSADPETNQKETRTWPTAQ
ncbi:4Fe-4S dicluster domain-containing protein [Geomonas azotofigens]|uniref:4Fe-4S dicluster domain-containing protein n=1 Tax=Geomonas azotofigens TaxID=2843196 RepID=UPI0038B3738E